MITLLVGSNNVHKAEELRAILETQNIAQILMPSAIQGFPQEIPETGTTLEENAYIKAVTIFHTTGITCIADDTGLEVDALQGAPGVYTARYAGGNATYADNRAKLLDALKNTPPEKRTARFRTVICYHDALRVSFAEGVCEGRISEVESGSGGFGYDAVFVPDGFSTTFAEMDATAKNAISHRGRALQELSRLLREYHKHEE